MSHLIVDTRERALIPLIQELLAENVDLTLQIEQINVGDFVIADNEQILMCIERKTYEDFADSIKDGRYRNKDKMIEYRAQTNCRLVYLIEGPAFPATTRKFHRIPYAAIQGAEDHLMIEDNIQIIHVSDTAHTARRIVDFMKVYLSIRVSGAGQIQPITVDQLKTLKTRTEKPTLDIAEDCWNALPFISRDTAKILMVRSFREFFESDPTFIDSLTIKNGNVLNAKGKKSLHELHASAPEVSLLVLKTVVGISLDTARTILNARKLSEIKEVADISDINIGKGARALRLGEAKATKIINVLNAKLIL